MTKSDKNILKNTQWLILGREYTILFIFVFIFIYFNLILCVIHFYTPYSITHPSILTLQLLHIQHFLPTTIQVLYSISGLILIIYFF